jgi:hypothetical protein
VCQYPRSLRNQSQSGLYSARIGRWSPCPYDCVLCGSVGLWGASSTLLHCSPLCMWRCRAADTICVDAPYSVHVTLLHCCFYCCWIWALHMWTVHQFLRIATALNKACFGSSFAFVSVAVWPGMLLVNNNVDYGAAFSCSCVGCGWTYCTSMLNDKFKQWILKCYRASVIIIVLINLFLWKWKRDTCISPLLSLDNSRKINIDF